LNDAPKSRGAIKNRKDNHDSQVEQAPSGTAMMIVGVLMMNTGALMLFLVRDSYPMWAIISGAGVFCLGVGAAQRRQTP
jgi:hypothetical protein